MRSNPGSLAIAIAVAISACAPVVDGPVDHQHAIDRDEADRLAAQLAQLPGVVTAAVVLHHALRDPLAVTAPSPATFTAVIATDDRADAGALRAATARLAHATLPELPADAVLAIEVNARVHRPIVTKVGPFVVEESSRNALRATLAVGCLAIAGLAVAVAIGRGARQRRENSAQ